MQLSRIERTQKWASALTPEEQKEMSEVIAMLRELAAQGHLAGTATLAACYDCESERWR